VVLSTSPTLVTPNLGTPSTLVGTNITGTAAGLSIGGNAATASNPIGEGQTWQTVTRLANTNYTNSTGKSIMVSLYALGTLQLTVDGLIVAQSTVNNAGNSITAIVQNGSVYSCNQAAWVAELR
jgi:hypothetical protein